jgi:hypothetical protein
VSGVPYHAWTHRPKAAGGTDPIPGFGEIKSFKATYTAAPQTVGGGSSADVLWDTAGETNRNPECFVHQHDASSGTEWDVLRVLEDGVYTAMIRVDAFTAFAYGQANIALAMFRYDETTISSKTWPYDSLSGHSDAHYTWTFEMDGTGGSNRKFSIQFTNLHSPIAGTDDNVNLDNLTLAVYKWPGAIPL